MYKKEIYLISIIFIIGSLIGAPAFVFGQDEGAALNDQALNQDVDQLNSQIQDKKSQIQDLQNKQSQYETAINEKQSEQSSLKNELAILDNRLAKAELDIEVTATDIDQVNLEIQKNNLDIANKNEKIAEKKNQIAHILQLLYQSDNVTSLEILLVNNSFADFLSQVKYIEDVNDSVKNSLDDLEVLKNQLEAEGNTLAAKDQELLKLKAQLENNQAQLDYEKNTKVIIIQQVNDSERQYQDLLSSAKQEQVQAESDITTIEKTIRAKMSKQQGVDLDLNENGFIWPVPKNIITAYFHDPDYPFRKIFEHPAIDIKAAQGTTVHAAASGYVAHVQSDGSPNYAYIMIIHGNGLATVYGHVSAVYVSDDEYVNSRTKYRSLRRYARHAGFW